MPIKISAMPPNLNYLFNSPSTIAALDSIITKKPESTTPLLSITQPQPFTEPQSITHSQLLKKITAILIDIKSIANKNKNTFKELNEQLTQESVMEWLDKHGSLILEVSLAIGWAIYRYLISRKNKKINNISVV